MTEVENYGTITAAISDADTVAGNVLVTDSTPTWYFWNEGIIDFLGKSITLKSQDMVPQHNELPHVVFNGSANAILEGFYIAGGNNPWGDPAEPYCVKANGNATVTVRNNEIYNCVNAGVRVDAGSTATVSNNLIHDNCRGVSTAGSANITWNTIRDGMSGTMNCNNSGPGVVCFAGAPSVVITNNTITQFHTGNTTNGGGISCVANTATINGNNITSNEARYGGGIYFRGSGTITGNTIIGNTAWGTGVGATGGGGGADIGGGVISFKNSNTVTNNITDGYGGGISAMVVGSTTTIGGATLAEGNNISSNTAGYAGGGLCMRYDNTISNNTISNNTSTGQIGGGGIMYYGGGYSLMSSNTLSGNVSTYAENGGGGILFFDMSAGGGKIEKNIIINNNTAGWAGGGMSLIVGNSNPPAGHFVEVNNNTIASNTSPRGGGISVTNSSIPVCAGQNPIIDSNIIWDNTASVAGSGIWFDTFWAQCSVVRYSDVQGGLWTGTGNVSTNPLFTNPGAGNYYINAPACINSGNQAFGAGTDMGAVPHP